MGSSIIITPHFPILCYRKTLDTQSNSSVALLTSSCNIIYINNLYFKTNLALLGAISLAFNFTVDIVDLVNVIKLL